MQLPQRSKFLCKGDALHTHILTQRWQDLTQKMTQIGFWTSENAMGRQSHLLEAPLSEAIDISHQCVQILV